MVKTVETDEFLDAGSQAVIIDVRTPAEYDLGHIPGAINIPLFSNEERVVVGTIYIQVGRDQAVEKGLEFVGARLADIVRQAKSVSQGMALYIYCWRGGMRSGSMAWLLSTAGLEVYLLKGGYKTYRRRFVAMLEQPWKMMVLAGPTGCGKTEILQEIEHQGHQMLDLEGIACHKGSAFGGFGQHPQPTTEHFINLLHQKMRTFDRQRTLWCEGESMLIGHVFLPQKLYDIIRQAPIFRVNMDIEQRLDRLCNEYGTFGTETLRTAFGKISKRSGTEQTAAALAALDNGDIRTAARIALLYYDKAYAKSLSPNVIETILVDNSSIKQAALDIIKLAK